jgi:hypothetical protein
LTKMVTLQNLYMMADSLIWGESRSNGNVWITTENLVNLYRTIN